MALVVLMKTMAGALLFLFLFMNHQFANNAFRRALCKTPR